MSPAGEGQPQLPLRLQFRVRLALEPLSSAVNGLVLPRKHGSRMETVLGTHKAQPLPSRTFYSRDRTKPAAQAGPCQPPLTLSRGSRRGHGPAFQAPGARRGVVTLFSQGYPGSLAHWSSAASLAVSPGTGRWAVAMPIIISTFVKDFFVFKETFEVIDESHAR